MTSIGFLFISITVGSFLLSPSLAIAGSELRIDADNQFGYAEALFIKEDFSRAVGEYKRFVYFFPEDDRVEQAKFNIGMSFFKSSRYLEAIQSFTALIDTFRDTELSIKSYLMISQCHIKRKAPAAAVLGLHNLAALTDDGDVRDEANYRIGWIYLEMADWDKARRYFDKINPPNQHKYRLKRLTAELGRKDKVIAQKKPGLAGFLSIIPGGGYLYCERYKDALIAFLANSVLMVAAYESFDEDLDALGGIISFVELGFYAGNIFGAAAAARKYNTMKTRQFIDHLKKNTKITFSTGYRNQAMMLSLQYRF